MKDHSPESYFDTLFLTCHVSNNLDGVSRSEVYLLSYISCLLSLYDRQPVSFWGYDFAVTEYGYPFSSAVQGSLTHLVQNGEIYKADSASHTFSPTDRGKTRLRTLSTLGRFAKRKPFLEAASASLLTLPNGTLRLAVKNDPNVQSAIRHNRDTLLLSEPSVSDIYEEFSLLSDVIGVETTDLLFPAIAWARARSIQTQ